MKLAAKLIIVTVLAVLAVLAVRGYQNARRQMALVEADARESAWLVGRALRPALVEVWRREGRERALEVLSYARDRVRLARPWDLRFVSARPETDAERPLISMQRLDRVWQGAEATFVEPAGETDRLVTYLPMEVDGERVGVLEVSGLMTARDDRFEAEIAQLEQRTVIGALVAILSIAVTGFVLVGRPMRKLVAKARRIGAGDLSEPLAMHQRDELGELAREINEMCVRLQAEQGRADKETARRLAAAEQLRHADRLNTVGKLASGLAHELGTPLNVVSGRAKMIARGQVRGPEVEESARTIVEQSERMTRIIKQLLGFARRRRPQRTREGLRELAQHTLGLLGPMARKAQVTLDVQGDAAGPSAEVDASLIEQALTNLVVNAIQAMPNGGEVTVTVAEQEVTPPADVAGAPGRYAVIQVQDRGVGMDAEQLARAFEPFYTTKDVGEGTGLGLSVAYGIVRDHNGWIEASSEVNMGSRFSIYLPLSGPTEENDVYLASGR